MTVSPNQIIIFLKKKKKCMPHSFNLFILIQKSDFIKFIVKNKPLHEYLDEKINIID